MAHTAVLYARVSIASEESVSVDRQLASGRRYAEARGWEIVGEFVDDGVSATKRKPEARNGWRSMLDCEAEFEAVVVWKVDRLARRVIHFLHADESLQERGAAVVCVDDPIDMSTAQGRAFATMLAVFAEMEAAATSARVIASRKHLIESGRITGGGLPYGWRKVANPDGAGWVLAQDPEQIKWVRGMVRHFMNGEGSSTIVRWLDKSGAPVPRPDTVLRRHPGWGVNAVRDILRNPVMAGMVTIATRPGTGDYTRELLRDEHGNPVIRKGVGIVSPERHAEIVGRLDALSALHMAGRVRAKDVSTLVQGIAWCGVCDRVTPMTRGRTRHQSVMRCSECRQNIYLEGLATLLERRLITERGTMPMWLRTGPTEGADPARLQKLANVDQELAAAAVALTRDRADMTALGRQIARLKKTRKELRDTAGATTRGTLEPLDMTVEDVWRRCVNDVQRQHVLAGQIERLNIHPGNPRPGNRLDATRVRLDWRGPLDKPTAPPDMLANQPGELAFGDWDRWIGMPAAAAIIDCGVGAIAKRAAAGEIERRPQRGRRPSLSKVSVLALAGRLRAEDPEPGLWISEPAAMRLLGVDANTLHRAIASGDVVRREVPCAIPAYLKESVLRFARQSGNEEQPVPV